jgi:nickel/cobalt exporter
MIPVPRGGRSLGRVVALFAAAALCLMVGGQSAGAAPLVTWDELTPSTEPYDNPFDEMPAAQMTDLQRILRARMLEEDGRPDEALSAAAAEARRRLEAAGLDIAALFAQRDRIIERRREAATGVTAAHLGAEVVMDGFALPLKEEAGRVVEFLLVPWVGACIHTPPPAPNQIVHVSMPGGIEISGRYHAVRLQGRLEHRPAQHDLFLVDGARHIDVAYAMVDATPGGAPDAIVAPRAAESAVSSFAGLVATISRVFTSAMSAMRDDRSLAAIAPAILIAFAYGLLHTLGPGHGKAVVVSYFIGQGGSLRRGLVMGTRIAAFHVLSAIVVVFLLDFAVREATGAAPSDYRLIRLGSYAAIMAIGAAMLWQAVRAILAHRTVAAASRHHAHAGHACAHDHGGGCMACEAVTGTRTGGTWVALAVGAVPCTGALLVMLFGLANDLIAPAILMVVAISAGMAVAMAGIGIAAILGRRFVERRLVSDGIGQRRFELGARLAGAASVVVIGAGLFGLALASPTGAPSTAAERATETQFVAAGDAAIRAK